MAARGSAGQPATQPSTSLPPNHPLVIELASLRQQLQQYQKAAHQSSIQLQGARLEVNVLKDKQAKLEGSEAALRAEAESLR